MDQALASEAAYCARMNWPRLRALVAQVCALVGWASGPAPAQLPAYLRLAALRLLRPAEAMARRLVLLEAVAEALPSVKISAHPGRDPGSPATGRRQAAKDPGLRREERKLLLPLTDTLPGFPAPHNDQRRIPDAEVPRVRLMDASAVWTPPPGASRDADRPVPSARTFARLAALQALLDDPAPAARRMARWLARSAAMGALPPEHRRPARISPLRPGRPPGYRRRGGDRLFASALSEVQRICALALERPPPDLAQAQAASSTMRATSVA